MGFEERTLECSDCGKTFAFTAEEQEQFQARGYTNDPKRCPNAVRQGKHSRTDKMATATEYQLWLQAATPDVPRGMQ